MNIKKGFTIIELLVTIALIAVVFGMGVGVYSNVSRRAKERLYESKKQIAIAAAEKYASKNILTTEDGFTREISIDFLIYRGYITPDNKIGDFVNPTDKSFMNCDSISITNYGEDNESITYNVSENKEQESSVCSNNIYRLKGTTVSGNINSGTWTNNNITLSLENTDNDIDFINRLKQKYGNDFTTTYEWYSIDESEETILSGEDYTSNQMTFTDEQATNVAVRYSLLFGNKYEYTGFVHDEDAFIVKIDKTAPNIDVTVNNDTWSSNRSVYFSITDNPNFEKPLNSGIASYNYMKDNSTISKTTSDYEENLNISSINYENFSGTITVNDVAGNTSSKSYTVSKVDGDDPTCSISTNYSSRVTGNDGNTWYDKFNSVSLSVSMKDKTSNLVKYTLEENSKNNYTYSSSIVSEDTTYLGSSQTASTSYSFDDNNSGARYIKYTITDEAGNTGECSKTIYVDAIKPSCDASFSTTSTFNGAINDKGAGIVTTANTSGSTSNINGYYMLWNKEGSTTPTEYLVPSSGNSWYNPSLNTLTTSLSETSYTRYLQYTIIDKFGYRASCSANNSAKKVYISLSNPKEGTPTSTPYNINIYATVNGDMIKYWHYSWDQITWYDFPKDSSGNRMYYGKSSFNLNIGSVTPFNSNRYDGYLYIRAKDSNGNYSNVAYTNVKYDNREPTINIQYLKDDGSSSPVLTDQSGNKGYEIDTILKVTCGNGATNVAIRDYGSGVCLADSKCGTGTSSTHKLSNTGKGYQFKVSCYNSVSTGTTTQNVTVNVFKTVAGACTSYDSCSSCGCASYTTYSQNESNIKYCEKWTYTGSSEQGHYYPRECGYTSTKYVSPYIIKLQVYCSQENENTDPSGNTYYLGYTKYYSCSKMSSYCSKYNSCSSCACTSNEWVWSI